MLKPHQEEAARSEAAVGPSGAIFRFLMFFSCARASALLVSACALPLRSSVCLQTSGPGAHVPRCRPLAATGGGGLVVGWWVRSHSAPVQSAAILFPSLLICSIVLEQQCSFGLVIICIDVKLLQIKHLHRNKEITTNQNNIFKNVFSF